MMKVGDIVYVKVSHDEIWYFEVSSIDYTNNRCTPLLGTILEERLDVSPREVSYSMSNYDNSVQSFSLGDCYAVRGISLEVYEESIGL